MEKGTRFKAHGYTDDEQKTSWSLIPDKTGPYVYDPIDSSSTSLPPTESGWYELLEDMHLYLCTLERVENWRLDKKLNQLITKIQVILDKKPDESCRRM